MLTWIANIEIFCFAASYGVALALEVSRLFFRAPVRVAVLAGFLIAGLTAHGLFLWSEAARNLADGVAPLSSWYYWCIIGAGVVAVIALAVTLRRPESSLGLFLLPLALALIGAAGAFGNAQPFSEPTAVSRWGVIHGLTLLLGTITIVLGFVAGALYLWQAYRLRHKIPTGRGFRLPSLEVLQRLNARSLYFSAIFLMVGVLSGILLNMLLQHRFPWSDPVVITSCVLLVWLVVVVVFELLYRPARQGQKVAYLTVASFVIFTLVLGILLVGQTAHSTSQRGEKYDRAYPAEESLSVGLVPAEAAFLQRRGLADSFIQRRAADQTVLLRSTRNRVVASTGASPAESRGITGKVVAGKSWLPPGQARRRATTPGGAA